jgi:mevalonate kinase
MSEQFHSHGKLLLTAEYLVVDGAHAFAVPCKFGQDLVVEDVEDSKSLEIYWKSYTNEGELWFEGIFVSREFPSRTGGSRTVVEPYSSSDDEVALKLSMLLFNAFKLVKEVPKRKFEIKTTLEFPQDWGLGSSSTLITNIASWLDINPYELFFAWTIGSGYDLACAKSDGPILYTKNGINPIIAEIDWNPSFKEEIFFVHLGSKQKSDVEVKKFAQLVFDREEAIQKMNVLTKSFLEANSLESFETVLEEHENVLSNILKRPTVKEMLFADYKGSVKSLGAWGGDFVMVTKRPGFRSYFNGKGCYTILSFEDMVYVG